MPVELRQSPPAGRLGSRTFMHRAWAVGAVSSRLLLLVSVPLALVLPALLLGPRPSEALWPTLFWQCVAVLGVLAAVWWVGVGRPMGRLKGAALALAGIHPDRPSPMAFPGSELAPLAQLLQQAQSRQVALLAELDARHRDLHRMAMYDALTGLPNRRLFRDLFERAAAQAHRTGRPMTLMFLDLDHFKEVNDRLGHPAGDELLLCISQRLSDTVRRADVVGRLSGDEFVALLPDTADVDVIAHTALRMIRAIEVPVPLEGGTARGEVSASIGVARFPRDGDDFDTLLDHADQAMYRAKTLGRGRYAVFQPTLTDDDARLAPGADRELTRALDQGEMQLYFQPVIDTESGQAVGAEALIRWRHPSEGVLSPARFIHRAEESGQLHALELGTLDQACAQLAQWKQMGLQPGKVSINVSAPEFRHVAWAAELGQALARHGIARGELAVELTESTLMGDAESTQERVTALRGLGVPLVIDDFGSGPISLARLGELRPAMLKLDPAFVRRLPDDPAARALIEGIVGLARSLHIAVVAGNVETEAQRDALAALGCHLQQGFLFARPQPALPEPAWPLPAGPQPSPWPDQGANDSVLGDLLPAGQQPARVVGLRPV